MKFLYIYVSYKKFVKTFFTVTFLKKLSKIESTPRDKTRNNELESYKWSGLRFTTKHFKEEREHIQKTIYKMINEYGGVKKVAEPYF